METGIKVLIVEDEWLIGEDLKERLEALGATVLDPAPNCAAALEAIWNQHPDVAYVDTQLGSESCQVVIEECDRQGIPTVISTGHVPRMLPDYLQHRATLAKPFVEDAVNESLHRLSAAVVAIARSR